MRILLLVTFALSACTPRKDTCSDAECPAEPSCPIIAAFADADGDGFTLSASVAVEACDGVTPPSGYLAAQHGDDCDDGDPSKYQMLARDNDGDGYTAPGSEACVATPEKHITPHGADCDDNVPTVWLERRAHVDGDLDTHGVSAETVLCLADATLPTGYVDLADDDCDSDPHNWSSTGCTTCGDYDGDGFHGGCDDAAFFGSVDCDDSDAHVRPGQTFDIPLDGRDQDCTGGDPVPDESFAVFVSPAGDDVTGDGTRAAPLQNLQAAVDMAHTAGKVVLAAGGTYVNCSSINAPLYGGYNASFTERSLSSTASVVAASGGGVCLNIVSDAEVVDGLTVRAGCTAVQLTAFNGSTTYLSHLEGGTADCATSVRTGLRIYGLIAGSGATVYLDHDLFVGENTMSPAHTTGQAAAAYVDGPMRIFSRDSTFLGSAATGNTDGSAIGADLHDTVDWQSLRDVFQGGNAGGPVAVFLQNQSQLRAELATISGVGGSNAAYPRGVRLTGDTAIDVRRSVIEGGRVGVDNGSSNAAAIENGSNQPYYLINNVIRALGGPSGTQGVPSRGIYQCNASSTAALVAIGNYIGGGEDSYDSQAIFTCDPYTPTLINNILVAGPADYAVTIAINAGAVIDARNNLFYADGSSESCPFKDLGASGCSGDLGPLAGSGNIIGDPLFDLATGHIAAGSPAHNAGAPPPTGLFSEPIDDIDGVRRPIGTWDIGPDELP